MLPFLKEMKKMAWLQDDEALTEWKKLIAEDQNFIWQ